jgi:GNAT superfamily N-acetyltransferase
MADLEIRPGDADDAPKLLALFDDVVAWRGRGAGACLIAQAIAIGRERGVEQLRVDCWDGVAALPAQYERLGFTRVGSFDVGDWPGAILVRAL